MKSIKNKNLLLKIEDFKLMLKSFGSVKNMDDNSRQQKIALLDKVFTPSTPVRERELFSGRLHQIGKILESINESGKHIILYGERGVGKTSLANVIEGFPTSLSIKSTCNRHDDYSSIWKKVFRKIVIPLTDGEWEEEMSSEKISLLEKYLYNDDEIKNSSDVLNILDDIEIPILFIFDEFDSVQDANTRKKFADTIKILSDNKPKITILIVGIADNVNELIGEHASIERCTTQVKLPVMPDDELREIIDKGLKALELSIEDKVRNDIVSLSQGFPHYTHLLARHSASITLYSQTNKISKKHFDLAIKNAISDVHESIRESYRKAVATVKKGTDFNDVISACAKVKNDEYGTFRLVDLQDILSEIKGKPVKTQSYVYHVGKLCEDDRGSILQKIGVKNKYRYRFRNPLVKAFVRLKNYESSIKEIY